MVDQLEALEQVRATAIDLGMKFGPKLFAALVILAVGYVAAGWVGRLAGNALERLHLEPPLRRLLARVTRLLVILLFAIMALQNLGVELLPLIAGLGVAGAGVALAMQGVLGNVIAGLTIILTRPFLVGDYVSISREEGEVLDISLANTTLGHADRSRVVIPNRRIVGEILHNYGKVRQLDLEVGVAYGTDIGAATHAVEEVLRANRRVLRDPAPVVGVTKLGDSAIELRVAPWVAVADYIAAGAEINQAILESFGRRRIVIPLPQREVRMLAAA